MVGEGLSQIYAAVGDRVRIRGVGTTGSGRELIGELVGADTVNDEITAHKTGADFIGTKLLGREVDTIFEIGGQDSKFISIEDGIVVDFSMNEACAAGTGSFLEEQAQKLDVNIVDEFSALAFESPAPIRLGERCTVYMEQDVSSYLKKGAGKKDLIAGLSYSVVQNYLNRVVRGRHIGEVIFFQGGTAYNDSVAAAFSEVLGREIIVPAVQRRHRGDRLGPPCPGEDEGPREGVALPRVRFVEDRLQHQGVHLQGVPELLRHPGIHRDGGEDLLGGQVQRQVSQEGEDGREACHPRPCPPLREASRGGLRRGRRREDRDGDRQVSDSLGKAAPGGGALTAGIPRAMFYYDRFPFWRTWLEALGIEVAVSPPTNRGIINRGLEETVAEPCCPIQTAHGHVAALVEEGVDIVLVPNVIDSETETPEIESYLCPWAQTLPFVLRGMPSLEGREDLILAPTVHFREGPVTVEKELWESAKRFGIGRARHRTAVKAAFAALEIFREKVLASGANALKAIEEAGEQGIVIAGRPYNIFDKEINLDVPSKLRDYYGMNVVPIAFLPLGGIDVDAAGENMFWHYGRRILQAARFVDGGRTCTSYTSRISNAARIRTLSISAAGSPAVRGSPSSSTRTGTTPA